MSFVMLTESQIVPHQISTGHGDAALPNKAHDPKEVAHRRLPGGREDSLFVQVESADRLFEILSSRSDIDHPICSECTELLLTSLQSRLSASIKERDTYISFLKSLQSSVPTASQVAKAQASLDSVKAAESKAFAELIALEKEKEGLDDEIADLEAQSVDLDAEEQAFWRSRNVFAASLTSFQNERDAVTAAYEHDIQQLEKLQRTNVYNDTFSIGHDGHFGTINGLRLGRLPPPRNVDWSEINAAWGTAALLLATIADKLKFTFHGYTIKPMGSTSTIDKLDFSSPQASTTSHTRSSKVKMEEQPTKTTSLDLFSSGDLPLGRMLLHRRLDAGMVAFLDCLRQLGDFVEMDLGHLDVTTRVSNPVSPDISKNSARQGTGMGLPYAIRKDKIGDTSIKLSVSDDEAWTRACKFTLTCCKYLLAHVSYMDGPDRSGRRSGAT